VESNLVGALEGLFVDPAKGDLHLTPAGGEAARNKGLPAPPGSTDFDGEPREGRADLGADRAKDPARAEAKAGR
jgi:hypothetical protein